MFKFAFMSCEKFVLHFLVKSGQVDMESLYYLLYLAWVELMEYIESFSFSFYSDL